MSANRENILFVAANPMGTNRLKTKKEFKKIKKLQSQFDRSNLYILKSVDKASVKKLTNKVFKWNPYILHLSNHNTRFGDMLIEEERSRNPVEVCREAFGDFFGFSEDNLQLVFLNSCYSIEQAEGVSKHIDNVITMSTKVPDDFAINFATDFYKMLFLKKDYLLSFAYAHNNIRMYNPTKINIPQFYEKGKMIEVENLRKNPSYNNDVLNNLRLEVANIEAESKSLKEKRQEKLLSSPYKKALDFLWEKKLYLATKAAVIALPGEDTRTQIKRDLLIVELIDILEYIHDAILVGNKAPLNKWELDSSFNASVTICSLNEIINFLYTDKILCENDKRILVQAIEFLIKQL